MTMEDVSNDETLRAINHPQHSAVVVEMGSPTVIISLGCLH